MFFADRSQDVNQSPVTYNSCTLLHNPATLALELSADEHEPPRSASPASPHPAHARRLLLPLHPRRPRTGNNSPRRPRRRKTNRPLLDQGLSAGLWTNKSLEIEFHERFDEDISQFYEYFVQAGLAFRPRPWLMILPSYRYQRFPASATAYENRLLLNLTVARPQGTWRPNLRTLIEGRFPDNRAASARLRFRPGLDYVLPFRTPRPPVLVLSNEFFLVPWDNPYANGGTYTQNRAQVGVRLPLTSSLTLRPYFMVQSVHLPTEWENNNILGLSLTCKLTRTPKAK